MTDETIGLLGGGAREAAMAEGLLVGKNTKIISIGANNPQIYSWAIKNIEEINSDKLAKILREFQVRKVVPGNEKYLVLGGELEKHGFGLIAPSLETNFIELSKARTTRFLKKIGMGCFLPESRIFKGPKSVGRAFKILEKWYPDGVVIKPSNPSGGKGVKLSQEHFANINEAKQYLRDLLVWKKQVVVIQEEVGGIEFALQAFVDIFGHTAFMSPVFDCKRRYIGDCGPNTGSTGSITGKNGKLPFIPESAVEKAKELMRRIILSLKTYKGILYGQFMLTRDGIKIIEFNARFGDPEACNVIPLLDVENSANLAEICDAIINGTLNRLSIRFRSEPTVVKCVFPELYPEKSEPFQIHINETKFPVKMYFGNVVKKNGGVLFTTDSRSFAIRAEGGDIPEASEIANSAIEQIFAGQLSKNMLDYRPDIGTAEHIEIQMEKLKSI